MEEKNVASARTQSAIPKNENVLPENCHLDYRDFYFFPSCRSSSQYFNFACVGFTDKSNTSMLYLSRAETKLSFTEDEEFRLSDSEHVWIATLHTETFFLIPSSNYPAPESFPFFIFLFSTNRSSPQILRVLLPLTSTTKSWRM
eukprot:Gregarina_sp_Poly_1__3127@NODE_1882_length_3141_cov_39_761874_g1221_i0_p2_GENE_NODE_1882_length_3141_cov_39_761874_g1221_i0NODE_1882_length_3141_cov_39_761874_g1221_i0_p2_ORF_typecomplete_len144_score10_25_NODE_1882_length_3141_cov_39_761874_g1221_i0202633